MTSIHINAHLRHKEFTLDIDFALPDSGVSVILGPSGSGKSTLLRLIAGLEKPDDGFVSVSNAIWVDSQAGICRPPQQRRVGMVFQDYALFHHLTVAGNVGFGLPREGRTERVNEWLSRLRLASLANRYPHQLSGGQKQRVALARALAIEPDVLLLDEPFAALDSHLRRQLRDELLEIVSHVHQPVLMVTHDLDEARYLADNIGVIINGRLQRLGKTHDVFNYPQTLAVARVLGWRNLLPVKVIEGNSVSAAWGSLELEKEPDVNTAYLGIRAEHIRIVSDGSKGLHAKVLRVTELGGMRELVCQLNNDANIVLHRPWNEPVLAPGSELILQLPLQHIQLLTEDDSHRNNHLEALMHVDKPDASDVVFAPANTGK